MCAWLRSQGNGSGQPAGVVYLYNHGVDNVNLTGGLSVSGYVLNASYTNDNNVTFRDRYIEMWVLDTYAHYSMFGTGIKVDFSKYKSCIVNYRWSDESKHTISIDLTNVTQEGYIGLAISRLNTSNKASIYLAAMPTKTFENVYAYATTGQGSPMVSYDSRQCFVDEIVLVPETNLMRKVNLLGDINSLALTQPSNTTAAASTKRTFSKNSMVSGLSYVNDYRSANVSNLSATQDTISFTSSSAYGVGLVLSSDVVKESTYRVNYSTTGNTRVSVAYYQSDGTYITQSSLDANNYTFTVPSTAEYVLIVITNQGSSSGTSTFTLSSIMLDNITE